MNEQYAKYLGAIINLKIIALVFFVPLLFIPLPQNVNDARLFAEFSKQILFIAGSLALFTLWALKMVLERKVTVVRTPLDVPLIIFFLIYALAAAFSTDIFVSLFGFYGLFHPSILSMFAMILFYFTIVSNINSRTRLYTVGAFLTSLLLISLVNITNYLGWFMVPYEAAKVREWLPLISLGTLGFLTALALPISVGVALQSKLTWLRIVGLVYAIFFFISLMIVNAFGAWITLFAGVAIFLIFSPRAIQDKRERLYLAVTGALAIVLLVISLTPALRDSLVKPLIKGEDKEISLTSEKRLSLEHGWQVAAGAVSQRPFLGSGPGTFPFSYTRFAPLSINQTDNWNVRFEQASNEYVNIVSTAGILGLVAFIFVLFSLVKPLILFVTQSASVKENPISVFLLASAGAYIIGSFFFDTSLIIGLLFILLSGVTFSTLEDLGAKGVDKVNLKLVSLNAGAIRSFSESEKPGSNLLGYILFVPGLLLTAALLYIVFLSGSAEVKYQESIIAATENKAAETRDKLISAKNTFGYRDVYHRTLSLVDLRIAQGISNQEEQSEQSSMNIQGLVQEAINEGKIASGYQTPTTVGTSSPNVTNWESLAVVYTPLVGVVNGADNHAINAYAGAIERQPRNPLLYEALGNILLRIKKTDEAIRALETAVSLKPDLASTHYSLAQAYKQAKDRDADVALQLQQALSLLGEKSQDKTRIQTELDEISKNLPKGPTATKSATPSATRSP